MCIIYSNPGLSMKNRVVVTISVLLIFLMASPALVLSRTETTRQGKIDLYLYQSGTGTDRNGINDFHVNVGDTISIDVFIRNIRNEPVTGLETYFTVDDKYFKVVSHGKLIEGGFRPFVQGTYLGTSQIPYVNNTHGDSLSAADNGFSGWQLDYAELTNPPGGGGQRPSYSARFGIVSSFQLIAKAPCDSVSITQQVDTYYNRVTRYHTADSSDSYFFKNYQPCYITVTGAEIDPPLNDLFLIPAESDSSLDLDNHINVPSIPDSEFKWTVSGDNNIEVSIDPLTHIVTFTAPVGYKGYEDITFYAGDAFNPNMANDTMRVTVGYPPSLLESALPDTIFVYEDSLQVVLNLPDIVEDNDSSFGDLTWTFNSNGNINPTQSGTSLMIQGNEDYYGPDRLHITVKDEMEIMDSVSRPVWVYPINDAPELEELPDITFERTKSYELDMNEYASDADLDPLTVNYTTPEHLTVDIEGMNVILKGEVGFIGSENLILFVSDPIGLSAADTVTVEVTPLTGVPEWKRLPKIGFPQGSSYSDLILWDYVSDPDGETANLSFSFTNYDDVDSVYVSPQNGRLYLFDKDDTPGWDLITVTATDFDKNTSSTEMLVFIGPSDGTPIVAAIPDTTIRTGTESDWIDLDYYYYDVDHTDDQMTWTWAHAGDDSLADADIDPLSRNVRLATVYADSSGTDEIMFTAADPDGKTASDVSLITILGETRPVLDMPAKIAFITGTSITLDLDDYAGDPDFDNSELTWSWNGNVNIAIAEDTEDTTSSYPLKFSSTEGWTGWERVYFVVQNPFGGTAADSTLVFSMPDDGSPVVGGISHVRVKAGLCDSLNIDLDNYYYDMNTAERFMTWSVSETDSIEVEIDPFTHEISFCAPSPTFEGQEMVTISVSDGTHADSMFVAVNVYGATIGDVFSMSLFRNPMQGDYMDIYIASDKKLSGLPSLEVRVVNDTTNVTLKSIATDTLYYYHGNYLLPYEASLGLQQNALIIARGTTSAGKGIQDTLSFAYGRYGPAGGKICLGDVSVNIPENAFEEPEMLTLISESAVPNSTAKVAVDEVIFKGDIYTLAPLNLNVHVPLEIDAEICCRTEGAGIYRLSSGGWTFAGGSVSGNLLQAAIESGGKYRVGYDRIAPRIVNAESVDGTVSFIAEDFGSGIDSASLSIAYNDENLAFTFDPENSLVTVDVSDVYGVTDISLDVYIADRSGNVTSKCLDAHVEPLPGQFTVEQNMPNPFNPSTAITFSNTSGQRVTIEIYDILGRRVNVLTDDFYEPGTHNIIWDARDESGQIVSNGAYLYRVITGPHIITRKMLFMK